MPEVAVADGERAAAMDVDSNDRGALMALYEATGGPNWSDNTNWGSDLQLGEWYGVRTDSTGRVMVLNLVNNALTGPVPPELGSLDSLTWLYLSNNALTGPIPSELGNLAALEWAFLSNNALMGPIPPEFGNLANLAFLNLSDNALTGPIPSELDNLTSLTGLGLNSNQLVGLIPPELGNLASLTYLNLSDNALTGPIPPEFGNLKSLAWLDLNSNQLKGPIPPELDNLASLTWLDFTDNQLTDSIPAVLGNLAALQWLSLSDNALTGPIPAELGNLAALRWLSLSDNALTGPIPPELGNLARLTHLSLGQNNLVGSIPLELGTLVGLTWLGLDRNRLTGPIPPELGNLDRLTLLSLGQNSLAGAIPLELGTLVGLTWLGLDRNRLSGPIPSELGNLASLTGLNLTGNTGLAGALPGSLTGLHSLMTFHAGGTGLCAPTEPDFVAWLEGVGNQRVGRCAAAMAYLTQAVQSRLFPVPLIAGEESLLRVFVTAPNPDGSTIPLVRARFYRDDDEVYVAEIPGTPHPILAEVDEGFLEASANARIPGSVMRPGLEVVIDVDPEGSLDPGLGVAKRIPTEGRLAINVREMPLFDLTAIPFLWSENPDSLLIDQVAAMAADPQDHELLSLTADLLPVADMRVTAHAAVVTSSNSLYAVFSETGAIRVLEGGAGHYMGLLPSYSLLSGLASLGGRTSASIPSSDIIVHELGHNFNLRHAPCGGASQVDPDFPDRHGEIGAWGYSVRRLRWFSKGQLVPPHTTDLMSYCSYPLWISGYHFSKALGFRLEDEDAAAHRLAVAPVRSLLLWGGADLTGTPYLEPAFVADVPPAMPDATGDYKIEGWDVAGAELFSLAFAMPPLADTGEKAGSFAYALPVRPEWAGRLASLTLTGPGGTITLDGDTDSPMAIYRDRRTGQVRAILRGDSAQGATAPDGLVGPGFDVLISRGIPSDLR